MNDYPRKIGLYDPIFEKENCGVGAVANINGERTNLIVRNALEILSNLEHRGGFQSDGKTGDGAGILIQVPDRFLRSLDINKNLPPIGSYGVIHVFIERETEYRIKEKEYLFGYLNSSNYKIISERVLPVDLSLLTEVMGRTMPYMLEIIVSNGKYGRDLEKDLYITRRGIEKNVQSLFPDKEFYFLSFSSKTVCYKGMLASSNLKDFFLDLKNELVESAIALVHSRFSTNTFPNWDRAHPNRMMIHNGEINTIKGNIDSIKSREPLFESENYKGEMDKILPVVDRPSSDSAMFDNTLEFFVQNGKSLEEAMIMMIPECFTKEPDLSENVKALMEYNANLMEPWDGPASIIATDGEKMCAILDRNGLRPSKVFETVDGRLFITSETGALRIPDSMIKSKTCITPGKILCVDTLNHTVKRDTEIKEQLATMHPYRKWVEKPIQLNTIEIPSYKEESYTKEELLRKQYEAYYSEDEIRETILHMALNGAEQTGAMGVDTPLAVFSKEPRLLYDYFKQLFAQVTNPPIDSIRENHVTSTRVYLGGEGNLFKYSGKNLKPLKTTSPVLTIKDMYRLRNIKNEEIRCETVDIVFDYKKETLKDALKRINEEAARKIKDGATIIVLSERNTDRNHASIGSLLATGSVHMYLVDKKLRTKASLIIESNDARSTHHMACLIGFGASAVCPYLAFETINDYYVRGYIENKEKAIENFVLGSEKGIIKIASKMGISTIQSYIGSAIFEAIGISNEVIDDCFRGARSAIGGISYDEINEEIIKRHENAYNIEHTHLSLSGTFRYKKCGEEHIFDPEVMHTIQKAVRENDYSLYKKYANLVNSKKDHIRDYFEIDKSNPVEISMVEPVESIMKRFKVSAMSFGALSKEAHECLATAMNIIGGLSNSGEGGESKDRYGTLRSSRIKQVASARFGVDIEYLSDCDEIQIKVAQGAKPGEGGQLPAKKVYPWIAKSRNSTPGVTLISPPPHHDIYSIEDLEQLIFDLKNANPEARVSVKLCSEAGIGTIAAGVVKAGADGLTIVGYDGGTGASPLSSTYNAGIPWEIGLSEVHQTLILNGLRERIILAADSKLLSGRDLLIASILGAEQFGFGTLPLIALGCQMMRVCNLNTCPYGITTQDERLRGNFKGRVEYVINLMRFLAQDLRELMAESGVKSVDELIGDTKLLKQVKSGIKKNDSVDLSPILSTIGKSKKVHFEKMRKRGTKSTFDYNFLIPAVKEAIDTQKSVTLDVTLVNTIRSIGAVSSSYIIKNHGKSALKDESVILNAKGNGGNSFGAFATNGLKLVIEGDANDYVGKGLSGATIVIKPSKDFKMKSNLNLICGNVCLYGATSGNVYIDGRAGERFAARNSGAKVVSLGCGTNGLEYMTGGVALILGDVGINTAAGMSGGYAFIKGRENIGNINQSICTIKDLDKEDIQEVMEMMEKHIRETDSVYVRNCLETFDEREYFKIMPKDYEKMTTLIKKYVSEGLPYDMAELEAFKEGTK